MLLALALGHSLWATSRDGFTIDEPYHTAAGASYVLWGDYRLNPEHPPLVKLIELVNFALARRETAKALEWYALAQKDAAEQPDILVDVERQIQLVKTSPPGTVPALCNPAKE